jgi:toxin ParE1/3/4
MAYRVELTARAGRDLRRIYRNINAADSVQAQNWFNGLQAAVLSLDEHPARNPVTPEDETLRHLLYGGGRYVYRVIYAINQQASVVTVLHIRHGSRQAFSGETEVRRAADAFRPKRRSQNGNSQWGTGCRADGAQPRIPASSRP